VAITTGGRLAQMGIPTIIVPRASAPRAALRSSSQQLFI
jgi:glucose/mannose-6-phosphate isomerase